MNETVKSKNDDFICNKKKIFQQIFKILLSYLLTVIPHFRLLEPKQIIMTVTLFIIIMKMRTLCYGKLTCNVKDQIKRINIDIDFDNVLFWILPIILDK